MSASRRKAHFYLVVGHRAGFRRAALSDQRPGHKGPGTIQVRRTPEVTAISKNLTHRPKRRVKTLERESKGSPNEWTSSKGGGERGQEPCFQRSGGPNLI